MAETHWKKLTNPNYLGSWDFTRGEERVLTIRGIVVEEVIDMEKSGSEKKSCTVAHFNEDCKPMILNITNCKTIERLYNTPYIERWVGFRITVRVERVKAFGKLADALRIKGEKPATTPPSLLCNDCGGTIQGVEGYRAEQVAATNQKRFGVQLCAECSKKRKEANNEANT